MKKKLVVHFHVFYFDKLNYYLRKLKNLKLIDFDIFVTMTEDNKKRLLTSISERDMVRDYEIQAFKQI